MGFARQVVEAQRQADQHALAEIADGRDEQRPPRRTRIGHDLRHMLVLEAEPVKLERRRLARSRNPRSSASRRRNSRTPR